MEIEFSLDGETVRCPEGVSVAGALFHLRRRTARTTPRTCAPRSLFCGMGVCFDCVMEIDGRDGVRACMTFVRTGMTVRTQRGVTSIGAAR
jgi:predicted molibdopterin-dependent oxidoreductase YjgC